MSGELVIRADAGRETGIGHVMRCLALAHAWRERGGTVTFVGVAAAATRARVETDGFRFLQVEKNGGGLDDLAQLLDVLAGTDAAAAVVDGYHFDAGYQSAVRDAVPCLLVLDDYAHQAGYAADVLLNQNLGADELDYPPGELLLGPRYCLLRPEFLAAAAAPRAFPETAERVLVMLGGGEHTEVAELLLRILASAAPRRLHVTVVAGPESQGRAPATPRSLDVEVVREPDDVPRLLRDADLALLAAGSTCWEACLLGLPALTVVLAENQQRIADRLAAAGSLPTLGPIGRLDRAAAGRLRHLLEDASLRERISSESRALVDGRGAARVAERLALRAEAA